jgi:S1-C subfamily serine protease
MNVLDVVLILLVLASAIHGLRLGAAIQVFSFGGFWLGLFLGALLAPQAARLVGAPVWKASLSIVIVFGAAAALGVLGRQLGVQSWRVIHRARLTVADSGLGALVAVAATLLACWLAASILVNAPARFLSSQIEGSTIIQGLDKVLPPAPSVFSRIQGLINTQGFPQVFAQLAPTPAGPVTLPGAPQLQAAVNLAGASTVQIVGEGCGDIQEGSGFVVARGLVVTNAHVVAGVSQPTVRDNAGSHAAVPILFDPSFDLAVLRVDGLQDPPLRLASNDVGRGTQAAVLGYPEGGPFQAVGAGILQLFDAEGRDIYGQGLTIRSVYELQATVRPGNSGGPLVEPDGEVVGVVFSRSASDPDIGYALASPGVLARVDQAESSPRPTGSGTCVE